MSSQDNSDGPDRSLPPQVFVMEVPQAPDGMAAEPLTPRVTATAQTGRIVPAPPPELPVTAPPRPRRRNSLAVRLGVAGLIAAFSANVASNPRIADEAKAQVETRLSAGGSFVASSQVEAAAQEAGLDDPTVAEIVDDYEDAQLDALKTALLFAALLVLASFFATRNLPDRRFDELAAPADEPAPAAGAA